MHVHPFISSPLDGRGSSRGRSQAGRAHTSLAGNARHRGRIASGLGGPGSVGRGGLDMNLLGLDEHGDDLAGGKLKGAVVERRQQLANLTRVASDADPGGVVAGEDVVKHVLAAGQLVLGGLALDAGPQLVALGEALLEAEPGAEGADVRLVGAVVARVDADALAERLLDDGQEAVRAREGQVGKRLARGDDAAGQRRRVVRLKVGHAVLLEARLKVGVGLVGLLQAGVGQERIFPVRGAVAGLLGPVALRSVNSLDAEIADRKETHVPGRSAVVGLGGVVPALTVTTHDEHLILGVLGRLSVKLVDILLEAFPLGLVALGPISLGGLLALPLDGLALGVAGVGAVQEAKVPVGLGVVSSGRAIDQ